MFSICQQHKTYPHTFYKWKIITRVIEFCKVQLDTVSISVRYAISLRLSDKLHAHAVVMHTTEDFN